MDWEQHRGRLRSRWVGGLQEEMDGRGFIDGDFKARSRPEETCLDLDNPRSIQ